VNPSEKATSASPLNPTFASGGVRIFPQFSIFSGQNVVVIVGWSKTTPTSFIRPSHLSHLRTSILNVRLRSCAHGMRFLLCDFCFLFVEAATGKTETGASAFCSV
jgi:Mn2+/Fe2+ NRAMP family transporter